MNNKSYLRGVIGGIVFGLVASIPWIFLEVNTGIMTTIFTAMIAYGVYYGYEFCGGIYDERVESYVINTTISIVCFGLLIIIPLYELTRYGWPLNLETLIFWYRITDVKSIIFNLILSIVFALLGAKDAISRMGHMTWVVKRVEMNDINEQISIIIDGLYSLNAIDKESAVRFSEITDELPVDVVRETIKIMRNRKIVNVINDRCYINENRT